MRSTLIGSIRSNSLISIFSAFEEIVSLHSDSAVILTETETISFAKLAADVMRLARLLRLVGVEKGHRVLIEIPRSPSFVTATLAVLSLDAVFVPVSPGEPPARRQGIEETVGATAVIKCDNDGNPFATGLLRPFVPIVQSNGSEIAYIMHTSGSTGVPKSVALPTRALANCLSWHIDTLNFNHTSVISQMSLPTFDLSIAEVFLPLVSGGSMVMPTNSVSTDIMTVIRTLAASNVTVIQLVPTVLGRFMRALFASPQLLRSMTRFRTQGHMVCNGESLPDSMRRDFYKLFPDATLHNCYGPTEACVAVTEYRCPKKDEPMKMFIGEPVPNVQLYVVDHSLAQVVDGEAGELLIGGEQNALGYVGNHDETERCFVRLNDRGDLAYRTGDLVRLEGGNLEFIGRIDTQVKYRSVRIELGEVESTAQRSGLCSDARALVVSNPATDDRQELVLVAAPKDVAVPALKAYLAHHLPKDRRPTLYLCIDTLPATSNGKLDRNQLTKLVSDMLRREDSWTEKESDSNSPLELLLNALAVITGRRYLGNVRWGDIALDSLAYIDLELRLLDIGLEIDEELMRHADHLTLSEISGLLTAVSSANSSLSQ